MTRSARATRVGVVAVIFTALAAVTASVPSEAGAEQRCSSSDRDAAARHKRAARRLMDREPAEAAHELEAAHRLCPGAWYLGNLVVLYERLGRIHQAMRTLDDYLELPDAGQLEEARAARQRLRALLVSVTIETEPPGAEVFLDGERLPGYETTPMRIEVDPGEHSLELHLDGYRLESRDIDGVASEDVEVEVVLERRDLTDGPPDDGLAPTFGEPAERGYTWTGGAQVGIGAMMPLATEQLQPFVALGLDAGGGLDFGRARVELVADLWASPAPDGYLLVASAGPRVGVPLGALPLSAEAAVLFGVSVVDVGLAGRELPVGTYTSFAMVIGVAMSWRATSWLEVVARPARLEVVGLSGGVSGGVGVRWGLDIGVRFRG